MRIRRHEIAPLADLRDADLRDANLRDTDLRGANLNSADLRDANLRGAYLNSANLSSADLRDADLRGANLRGAYLNSANLNSANLNSANLNSASLRDTDLRGANLYNADLRGANLRGADLSDAYLSSADLHGANLYNAKSIPPLVAAQLLVPPQEGDLIGWKKADGCLIKLRIPSDARRTSATTRKCRAEFADVLEIQGGTQACSERGGIYRVGERIHPDSWDDCRWKECSHGIHFFLTREEAEAWF